MALPEWCNKEYLQQFVGGFLWVINQTDNYTYCGEIAGLDIRDGHLEVTPTWWAVGVDHHNRRSMRHTGGWVRSVFKEHTVGLYAPANPDRPNDYDMPLYVAMPGITDGRLILDGGRIQDEMLVFYPPGKPLMQENQVRPANPASPVDESRKPLSGKVVVEMFEVGPDGKQRLIHRIEPSAGVDNDTP